MPNATFGYFVLGKPLACICQGLAIYTLLVGAFRTWRLQSAMVRGKALTGGIEIILIAIGMLLVSSDAHYFRWAPLRSLSKAEDRLIDSVDVLCTPGCC